MAEPLGPSWPLSNIEVLIQTGTVTFLEEVTLGMKSERKAETIAFSLSGVIFQEHPRHNGVVNAAFDGNKRSDS